MSLIFGIPREGASPASAELLLVAAPGRLSRFNELPRPSAEHNHVLIRDTEESSRQFWLRGLRRARSMVARGKHIRRLSYVAAPTDEGGFLPERVAKAFASTLCPGSTMVVLAPGTSRRLAFRTLERIQPSLRDITLQAVFDDLLPEEPLTLEEQLTPEEPSRVRSPSLARTSSQEYVTDHGSAVA